MGARPEPSTKHFRSCETREVDTGAHLSDKFRRDRFEASRDPHASRRRDSGRVGVKTLEEFHEEASEQASEEGPAAWTGRRRGPPDILTIIVEGSDKLRDQTVRSRPTDRAMLLGTGPGLRDPAQWLERKLLALGPGSVGLSSF